MTFRVNFAAAQAGRQTDFIQFLVTGRRCGFPPVGEIPKPSFNQTVKVEVFHAVEIRRVIIMTQNRRSRKLGGVVPIRRAIGSRGDHDLMWIHNHDECGSKSCSALANLSQHRLIDLATLGFHDKQIAFVWFSYQHVHSHVREFQAHIPHTLPYKTVQGKGLIGRKSNSGSCQ